MRLIAIESRRFNVVIVVTIESQPVNAVKMRDIRPVSAGLQVFKVSFLVFVTQGLTITLKAHVLVLSWLLVATYATRVVPIGNLLPDLWVLSITSCSQLPPENVGMRQVATAESVFAKTVTDVVGQLFVVIGVAVVQLVGMTEILKVHELWLLLKSVAVYTTRVLPLIKQSLRCLFN